MITILLFEFSILITILAIVLVIISVCVATIFLYSKMLCKFKIKYGYFLRMISIIFIILAFYKTIPNYGNFRYEYAQLFEFNMTRKNVVFKNLKNLKKYKGYTQ